MRNLPGTGRLAHLIGFLFCLVSQVVWANLDLDSEITEICYRGDFERVGRVITRVNGDDFHFASVDRPNYMRLRLDKGARNSETLVDIESSDSGHRPIFIALRLDEWKPSPARVVAPPDAISIVRWRRGETEIWLKIQSSSSQWIAVGDTLRPPDITTRVKFTFGISAKESVDENVADYRINRTNRMSNGDIGGNALSTIWLVDMTQSILNAFPAVDSELCSDNIEFDYRTRHVTTSESASGIVLGHQIHASFGGGPTLARGYTYDRFVFPWVTHNDEFETEITLTNVGDVAIPITLTACRSGDGCLDASRTIPANGSLSETSWELFPGYGTGLGYAVRFNGCNGQVKGSWSTGYRDSGLAIVERAVAHDLDRFRTVRDDQRLAARYSYGDSEQAEQKSFAIHFPFLPVNGGALSSWVIVNIGDYFLAEPAIATCFFYDATGELLAQLETPLLEPFIAHAVVTADIVPAGTDVSMIAICDQPITGVAYLSDSGGNLGFHQAQPVEVNLDELGAEPRGAE